MRRLLQVICVLFSAVSLLASCLNSDDTEVTYTDDMAIVSFSLGTTNRYMHTTSSTGADSIYKTTFTGSSYPFAIDQKQGLIYNLDSLPVGTDAEHLLVTVSAYSGTVGIKSLVSDSVFYVSSSDSLDFTQPRELRAYANDGSGYRAYKVSVNVHQEEPDSFRWNALGTRTEFAAMQDMRAVTLNGTVALFGTTDGAATVAYTTRDGETWTRQETVFGGNVCQDVVTNGHCAYLYADGKILRSDDLQNWTETAATEIQRLTGASTTELYALNADGALLCSADEGATWQEETLDEDKALLPVSGITAVTWPLATNDDIDYTLMAGNREGVAQALVWRKLTDYSTTRKESRWVYMEQASDNPNVLPALEHLTLLRYDGTVLALGKNPTSDPAYRLIYQTPDQGVNWRTADYQYPSALGEATVIAAAVDNNNHILLVCGGSGEIWRGRLNRLGWERQ